MGLFRRVIDFGRMPVMADRFRESADAAKRGDQEAAARALGFTLKPPDSGAG
jgi:hypothetical protein